MTSKEIAAQILELVGKESNIISCTHCVTRLRFSLKDDGKADRKKIKAIYTISKIIGKITTQISNR